MGAKRITSILTLPHITKCHQAHQSNIATSNSSLLSRGMVTISSFRVLVYTYGEKGRIIFGRIFPFDVTKFRITGTSLNPSANSISSLLSHIQIRVFTERRVHPKQTSDRMEGRVHNITYTEAKPMSDPSTAAGDIRSVSHPRLWETASRVRSTANVQVELFARNRAGG